MTTSTDPRRRTAAAAGALVVLAGLTALGVDAPWAEGGTLLAIAAAQWAVFGAGVALVRTLPVRTAVLLIVAGGAVLQVVAAGTHDPRRSDDVYRYVWDGRVQAAGIDPYRHPPDDPAVAPLRDGWLFPGEAGCAQAGKLPGCTLINRPSERTIYPPVAEASFVAVHAVAPYDHLLAWQAAAGLGAVAVSALLVGVLRRTRGDPRLAVLWAWCPVVALEAGNGAHVDVLGVLAAVAGLAAVARRPAVGGALLGVAVAVKLYPALVVVAALRRRPATVLGACAGVVALSYVPHVLAVGIDVLGYLPGYLREEGYDAGTRFALVSLVVPARAATVVAGVLLAGAALVALRRAAPGRPWDAALPFVGTVFLVATPYQAWYALLLVALVPLARRPEWLAVGAAGFPLYAVDAGDRVATARVSYGLALVVVLGALAVRRWGGRRAGASARPSGTMPVGPSAGMRALDRKSGGPPGGDAAGDRRGVGHPEATQRGGGTTGGHAVTAEQEDWRAARRHTGELGGGGDDRVGDAALGPSASTGSHVDEDGRPAQDLLPRGPGGHPGR
jgi:hypothetical protein